MCREGARELEPRRRLGLRPFRAQRNQGAEQFCGWCAPCIERSAYREAGRDLREAARQLTPVRDRLVTLQTIRDLSEGLRGEHAARPFGNLLSALRRRCLREALPQGESRKAHDQDSNEKRQMPREDLAAQEGLGRIGRWTENHAGRRAYTEAIAEPTPENLHEWRKRVKDLWYQWRLLRRVSPGKLRTRLKDLKALSAHLGDGHDVFMLQETVGALWRGDSQADELAALSRNSRAAQERLSRKATAIGKRFYRRNPPNSAGGSKAIGTTAVAVLISTGVSLPPLLRSSSRRGSDLPLPSTLSASPRDQRQGSPRWPLPRIPLAL